MSEQLTVEKIQAYVNEFNGLHSLGDRLVMELPPEHNDVIVHAPVDIYRFLLSQLAATTEERDELRKSDIAQGMGGLEVVRVDGDPTGRMMPDSFVIRSECATVTYKAIQEVEK